MIHPTLKHEQGAGDSARVVLLTGIDRLSLDSVAFALSDSSASANIITYDVRPDESAEQGIRVLRAIGRAAGFAMDANAQTESLPMDDCCLTCTVKHDVARVLESMHGETHDVMVVLPIGVEGTPVAQYIEDMAKLDEWSGGLRVAAIANAVGLDEFAERFFDDGQLCLYSAGPGTEEGDDSVGEGLFEERSTGTVAARLIREASCILELPVVGTGCLSRHVDAVDECRCRDIIAVLAGEGTVVYHDANEVSLGALTAAVEAVH